MNAQQLSAAMDVHQQWKVRLKAAIEVGRLDTPVTTVRRDDACAFGKWLNGSEIPSTQKQSAAYLNVKKLHAEFHCQAAKIAELAAAGRKDEARQQLGFDGSFGVASSALMAALRTWSV